jgi:phosphosulfolactate synthase (CoM biosynthesis protein A)
LKPTGGFDSVFETRIKGGLHPTTLKGKIKLIEFANQVGFQVLMATGVKMADL